MSHSSDNNKKTDKSGTSSDRNNQNEINSEISQPDTESPAPTSSSRVPSECGSEELQDLSWPTPFRRWSQSTNKSSSSSSTKSPPSGDTTPQESTTNTTDSQNERLVQPKIFRTWPSCIYGEPRRPKAMHANRNLMCRPFWYPNMTQMLVGHLTADQSQQSAAPSSQIGAMSLVNRPGPVNFASLFPPFQYVGPFITNNFLSCPNSAFKPFVKFIPSSTESAATSETNEDTAENQLSPQPDRNRSPSLYEAVLNMRTDRSSDGHKREQ